MQIVADYSFNNGEKYILDNYRTELAEITQIISRVTAEKYKTKISAEKTMKGRLLFSPSELNKAFKLEFEHKNYKNYKVPAKYIYGNFMENYISPKEVHTQAFRDMDFIKPGKKLGIEVQFGKYAFMVYNVCAKMTIFKNLGVIDAGIEIVPVKNLADEMSTGVSYFEQIAWDLEMRGVSNIDTPVYILGIDA